MTCIGVGYKRELQETVKPGGDKKSEQYHCGNISTMVTAERAPAARELAAAKVGVSGKVKRICPVFHEGNVSKS